MQKAALKELNNLVAEKEKRALVVSATGTGKTYLGAFAVKNFKPRRFLYVVHLNHDDFPIKFHSPSLLHQLLS